MGTVSLTFPISVFQFSQSSFTDTPCSTMMMIKVVLAVATLLAVTEAKCAWSGRCDNETGCSYGCLRGWCWSQCNGAGTLINGKPDECSWLPEWCWLDRTCSRDQDCAVRM